MIDCIMLVLILLLGIMCFRFVCRWIGFDFCLRGGVAVCVD